MTLGQTMTNDLTPAQAQALKAVESGQGLIVVTEDRREAPDELKGRHGITGSELDALLFGGLLTTYGGARLTARGRAALAKFGRAQERGGR